MNSWSVGEAKQQLSKVLRATALEPQRILNRGRLTAVVISPELFEAFDAWNQARQEQTLGGAFSEVRELCAEDEYVLEVGRRIDRRGWEPEPES